MTYMTAHALHVDTDDSSRPTTDPTTDRGPDADDGGANPKATPTAVRKPPVVCTAHALRDDNT